MSDVDFETLVQEFGRTLWAYLRFLGADRELADELRQQTFVALLEGNFRHQSAVQTAAWLRTVARRKYQEEMRRRGKGVAVADIEEMDSAWREGILDDRLDDALAALRDCLERLAPRSREALRCAIRMKRLAAAWRIVSVCREAA